VVFLEDFGTSQGASAHPLRFRKCHHHNPALVYRPLLVLACCDTLYQLRLDSYRQSTS